MEANELMIGDWVLINGTPRKIQAVDGVDDEIMADDELYTLAEDRYHSEDKVDGVPLTPEILEKNGFSGEGYNMGIVGFSKGPISELKDGYEVFIWRDNYLQIHHGFTHLKKYIKYIHELQHALRLCGIEKEIEL